MFSCFSSRTSHNYPFLLAVFGSLSLWFSKYSPKDHSHLSHVQWLACHGSSSDDNSVSQELECLERRVSLNGHHNSLSRGCPLHFLEEGMKPKRLTGLVPGTKMHVPVLSTQTFFLTCVMFRILFITLWGQDLSSLMHLRLWICRLKRQLSLIEVT